MNIMHPVITHMLILYGSTTGNTHKVAKYMKNKLNGNLNKVTMLNVANLEYPFTLDAKYDLIILCCSTWGIDPPVLQEDFEYWCINTKQASIINKRFAIIALGDKFYPYFGYSYEILNEYISKCDGIVDHALSIKIQDPWEDSMQILDNIINNMVSSVANK